VILPTARDQLRNIVEALAEAEAEELLSLVLELPGPQCPSCGFRLEKGLRLVWVGDPGAVAPLQCTTCKRWWRPAPVF
jgi:hypothetical protein